jgi:hypothetical protein
MSDIFKQQRAPINQGEFDGGGTDDEAGINNLRAQLGVPGGNAGGPPPGIQMTGNLPPQVQQMMNADHPLAGQAFQAPSFQSDDQGFNQHNPAAMHQQAKRMLRTPQQQPDQPQQPSFNPNFNPQQALQEARYGQFKDQKFEELLRRLQPKTGTYEEIELPSRGKFYLHNEGPSNGILHVRPMTGHEEQILMTPRLIKKNQALNKVFQECIGEQINPELLLSEDRTYLLIYLRGISYSPMYDVEVKCPDCTKPFQTQIHLNSLEVDYCPDDFNPMDLTDTLPDSGFQIRYRLSTGRDESLVQEHKDKRVKDWGDQVADDSTLFRASLLVDEIEGITNKMMIQQLLERLPIGDMAYLRELMNEPPFGVNTKVGIICPHCSHEFEVDMPMEVGFFFPKPILQKRKKQQA